MPSPDVDPRWASPWRLFFRALGATILAMGAAWLLFPQEASVIAVVLVAFAKADLVERLLDRNRDEIWSAGMSPVRANARLAGSLLVLFAGIFVAYALAVQVAATGLIELVFDRQIGDYGASGLQDTRFGSFGDILRHNAVVWLACLIVSLIYRHAGMLLVLAWNAAAWGALVSWLARRAADTRPEDALVYLGRSVICITPHLLLEALAYILVAMAGVFLARGLARHRLDSDAFLRVGRAILGIAALAMALLAAAAAVEATLAPRLVALLLH